MKSKVIFTIVTLVCAACLTGCILAVKMLAPANLYIAGYELESEQLHQEGLSEFAKVFAREIQDTLKAEYVFSLYGLTELQVKIKQYPVIYVFIECHDDKYNLKRQRLHVTVRKNGPDMTSELMQVKKKLETIFRKHGFSWTSNIDHSTWNR